MAWRKRHLFNFPHIPRAHNEPPAVRIIFDFLDNLVNLIDRTAIGSVRQFAPLRAVNGAEVAILISPFIPNRYAVFLKPADVCVTSQHPEQFVDDGFEVKFFSGEKRESLRKLESRLRTENRICAGAGAVGLLLAMFHHVAEELEVLDHRLFHRFN